MVCDAASQVVAMRAFHRHRYAYCARTVLGSTTAPTCVGQGIGSFCVRHAQHVPVQRYTFQANAGARRFYARHGFRAIVFSDVEAALLVAPTCSTRGSGRGRRTGSRA